jgi:Domain of unknown function (DUF4375)
MNMDKNSFLIDLSESKRTQFGKVEFSKQSAAQKVFSAIWTLESEVNGGGFADYLSNDQGATASFAPKALKEIGADACADIVNRALAIVCGNKSPTDSAKLKAAIEAMNDKTRVKLEAVDNDFFAYPDNLTNLLFEFVRKNPKDFGSVK